MILFKTLEITSQQQLLLFLVFTYEKLFLLTLFFILNCFLLFTYEEPFSQLVLHSLLFLNMKNNFFFF